MFIEAKDDGGGGDNWTTGAISRAKLQSNHHYQQTNIQLFTGRMPFLSPNQQCQTTEGKISHSMDLLTPSSPGGLPTLSLTTNSSWLPWGRVAVPLISHLMPVPHVCFCSHCSLLTFTRCRDRALLSTGPDSCKILVPCIFTYLLSKHSVDGHGYGGL